jgi:hypothetical protein
MPTTFQTSVNVVQAPGVPGDFASADPHFSWVTSGGVLVADTGGVTIGCFAWVSAAQNKVASTGSGAPDAFVHREMQATINVFPAEFGMTIPAGHRVGSLMTGGCFFAKNAGAGTAARGMKAFANLTNGSVSFAAAGATVSGSVETKWFCVGWGEGGTGASGELVKISHLPIG